MCYDEWGGGYMDQHEFEWVLGVIARRNGITKEQVREEMQIAMEEGMRSPDPVAQQLWAQIPRRGEKLTLEEFMEYLLSKM